MSSPENHATNSNLPAQGVGRRTVAKGLAWSVPVVAAGAILPHASASECTKMREDLQNGILFTVPKGATGITVTVIGASGGTGGGGSKNPGGMVGKETYSLTGPVSAAGLTLQLSAGSGGSKGTGSDGGDGGSGTSVSVSGAANGTLSAKGGDGGAGKNGATGGGGGGSTGSSVTPGTSTAGTASTSPKSSGKGEDGSAFVTYCV